jgi:hypothetical protein
LFALYTPTYTLAGGKQSRICRRTLELAGLLDMYNNGRIGPGHFTEDSGSTLRSPKTLPAAGRRETKRGGGFASLPPYPIQSRTTSMSATNRTDPEGDPL